MEPERWQNVERIYHSALKIERRQRGPYLLRACADDQALRAEVESLLKYAERPAKFFEKPAMEVVARSLAEDLSAQEETDNDTIDIDKDKTDKMIGARIAQYRLAEKLGEGGMGDVYRADRADHQFEKQVAIKLVRQGLDTEFVDSRLRKERQILADFEHENIARLLDGGTTEEGHPYFVMELVEGQPIDEYCDERKLGIAARIDLFQKVCSAVQYAHQRLVVHRDIKPSNILVAADGVPKLLDFGIATILSPETYSPEDAPTMTAMGMMTPQFASPEQLRGEVITTATDVYSLGVVLYKLLTGHSPYRQSSTSTYDLAHAICEVEPEKPSTIVGHPKQVADLPKRDRTRDPLKATPEWISKRRSTNPDKLRGTLSGDLDYILLKALRKEPQRRYASAKDFAEDLRSYSLGLPVSARNGTFSYRSSKFIRRNKLSLALTAVFALVVFAAGLAIIREARIARTQQARAEQRFNDVRQLAHSLLFDIHDSIQDLPGSTTARKILVDRALKYLDSLSKDSSDTPDLERELATAYERVGDVQGNPYNANLGDTAGALESYRKALRVRLDLGRNQTESFDDQAALAAIYVKFGFALRATKDFPAALEALKKAYAITEKLAADRKDNPQAQEALAGTSFAVALCLDDMGDLTGSVDYFRKSAAIREAMTGGAPAFQTQTQTKLAGVYGYLAGVMHMQGDQDAALALQSKAHDILDRQVKANPQNARLRQYLLENEYWTGFYLAEKGLPAQALPHYRIALAGYLKLSSADAHDVLAMRYLGKCYMSMGRALAADGKAAEGVQSARQAVRILETLVAADRADTNFKPSDLAYARSAVAEAYSRLAEQPGVSKTSISASWGEARSWYQQSLDTWLQLRQKAPLGSSDAKEPDKIAAEIARCDAALARSNAKNP
jgi:eukaryotic-like serine/threonine-protein kinase